MLPLLLGFSVLPGCRDKAEDQPLTDLDPSYSLVFTVEDGEARAGEDIRYMAYLDGGLEPIPVDALPTSNIEELRYIGGDAFQVTVAAEHTITAEAVYGGETYSAELLLEVQPGLPAGFDLSLSDVAAAAGDPLSYSFYAWDDYGNTVDTSAAVLELDSPDVVEVEGQLVSTVPGLYTAVGSFDGLVDEEQLLIVAGPPAGIDLSLDEEDLELDQTAVATVAVVDAYGNPVSDDWELWVEPGGDVAINYNALTFGAEGRYTVWAASSDGAFTDSVGPLLIDSTGPELGISDPPRGTQTTEPGQVVSGTATEEYTGIDRITVNGSPAAVNEDGSWEAWVDYDFGANLVHTEGVDGDGNATSDLRTVLSGDYQYYGAPVDEGIVIRISEAGFDSLEGIAADLIAVDDLLAGLPNPVVSQVEQTCWDILGWEECFDWYSIDLWIEDLSISGTSLELDPRSSGYIDAAATISDFYLALKAEGVIAEIPYSTSGELSADSIVLGMELYPYISGADLALSVPSLWVDLNNFELDNSFYDVIEAVLDFFGLDINGLLADLIEGMVEDMVYGEVTTLLQETFQDLEIVVPLELGLNTYTLEALFSQVSVDEQGMSLGMDTFFTAASWVSGDSAPGSLYAGYSAPVYGGPDDAAMELGLSVDFLNQLFHALWGGGLLELELSSEELGLDLSDFELFLPELTALSVGTRALQPPVVTPGTGENLFDLQIGDLELSLYSGDIREDNLWMRVYVQVDTGLELSVTESNTLLAGLGDLDIQFDLDYPDDRSAYAADAELLMETLVPLLLPTLTEALGEIPIPELQGFTLSGFAISPGGAEGGYMAIGGDLVVSE